MNKLQKLAELLLENTETLNLISTIFYDAFFCVVLKKPAENLRIFGRFGLLSE